MIGEKLRQLRRERHLTQQELSNILFVTASTIAMWETNVRKPSIDQLINLSKFFNVSVNWFLNENNTTIIGKGAEPETINISNESKKKLEDLIDNNSKILTEDDINILKKIIKVYKSTH